MHVVQKGMVTIFLSSLEYIGIIIYRVDLASCMPAFNFFLLSLRRRIWLPFGWVLDFDFEGDGGVLPGGSTHGDRDVASGGRTDDGGAASDSQGTTTTTLVMMVLFY